jgi:hypothetical protein
LVPWVETHGYPPGSLRDLEKPTRAEHQGKARGKLKAEMKRKRLRIEDCGLKRKKNGARAFLPVSFFNDVPRPCAPPELPRAPDPRRDIR